MPSTFSWNQCVRRVSFILFVVACILSLLSGRAQAQEFRVDCLPSNMIKQMNRFSVRGPLKVEADGTVQGQLSMTTRGVLDEAILGSLVNVTGKMETFEAGEITKESVALLDLHFDGGTMKLLLGGPRGSSTLLRNGTAYKSTCK